VRSQSLATLGYVLERFQRKELASLSPTLDPSALDWPARRGPVWIFANATNDWLQEARTPSQRLTRIIHLF